MLRGPLLEKSVVRHRKVEVPPFRQPERSDGDPKHGATRQSDQEPGPVLWPSVPAKDPGKRCQREVARQQQAFLPLQAVFARDERARLVGNRAGDGRREQGQERTRAPPREGAAARVIRGLSGLSDLGTETKLSRTACLFVRMGFLPEILALPVEAWIGLDLAIAVDFRPIGRSHLVLVADATLSPELHFQRTESAGTSPDGPAHCVSGPILPTRVPDSHVAIAYR